MFLAAILSVEELKHSGLNSNDTFFHLLKFMVSP